MRLAMESFEQIWESSRTHSLSWMYPTALWCGAGTLVVLCAIGNRWLRRFAKLVVIAIFSVMAVEFASHEIQEKWRLRREWAELYPERMTEEGYDALTVDGANMTLGPLIHGIQAFLLLAAVAALPWVLRKLVGFSRVRGMAAADVDVSVNVAVPPSDDPYRPPNVSS